MIMYTNNVENTIELGQKVGSLISGGIVIELVGDVGAGKTTFVKGLARGIGIDEVIQSPSYNINRFYVGKDKSKSLSHYDFYRLNDAGLIKNEIIETMNDTNTIIVIEWSEAVEDILPEDRLVVTFTSIDENMRKIEINAGGSKSNNILEGLIV